MGDAPLKCVDLYVVIIVLIIRFSLLTCVILSILLIPVYFVVAGIIYIAQKDGTLYINSKRVYHFIILIVISYHICYGLWTIGYCRQLRAAKKVPLHDFNPSNYGGKLTNAATPDTCYCVVLLFAFAISWQQYSIEQHIHSSIVLKHSIGGFIHLIRVVYNSLSSTSWHNRISNEWI